MVLFTEYNPFTHIVRGINGYGWNFFRQPSCMGALTAAGMALGSHEWYIRHQMNYLGIDQLGSRGVWILWLSEFQ